VLKEFNFLLLLPSAVSDFEVNRFDWYVAATTVALSISLEQFCEIISAVAA